MLIIKILGSISYAAYGPDHVITNFYNLKFCKIFANLTHIGKSRKLFPKNGRWLRGFSGNYFQVNFLSTYPWKIFFPKTGHNSKAFPETISRHWKKVSGKASESWHVFRKKYFFMGKYSWNLPGNSFRKIPWVTARFLEIVSGIF